MGPAAPRRERDLPSIEIVRPEVLASAWYRCGLYLIGQSGRLSPGMEWTVPVYRANSRDQSPEFLEWMFSVIYVESQFDPHAHSQAAAFGLMQITEVAERDAARTCALRPLRSLSDLYDPMTNIRYGSCYLSQLLQDAGGDWTRALVAYNGGGRQLLRYDSGQSIVAETANYVLAVQRAHRQCMAAPVAH